MTFRRKLTAAIVALLLQAGSISPTNLVRADEPTQQDQQSIINSLVSQLNQLQQNQQPASAAATTNAASTTAVQPNTPAPTEPTTIAVGGVTLTMDNIPAFVASLGYEAKKVNDNCYSIDASRGNWTLYVNIFPDAAQKKLWFFAYMREMKDMNGVHVDNLLKLLEANNSIGPTHFYVSKNVIYMGRAFENENVTAVRFRHELDQFFADCQRTEDLWSVERWNNADSQLSSNQTTPAPTAPTP